MKNIKVCIYICNNLYFINNDNIPGGVMVILKFIKLLNDNGIKSALYSKNINIKLNYNSLEIPLTNKIFNNTIVVYPEIVYGNPLNSKKVCRWILYDPMKRGGLNLINSWNKNDILCSYGDYDGGLKCKIKINVVDFNEDKITLKNNIKTKKYYLIHKALLCGYNSELLDIEIKYFSSLGFEEFKIKNINKMNEELSECLIFLSFDLNTYISNIAVLCGCLSIVKKSETDKRSYENIFEKRGCYNSIGIKSFNYDLLNKTYNYNERLYESNLYREYITTANNIDEFINYFKLNIIKF
jgi:hypothetical protein